MFIDLIDTKFNYLIIHCVWTGIYVNKNCILINIHIILGDLP